MAGQLEVIMKDLKKTFGDEVIGKDLKYREYERIQFSTPKLNEMLYGGMPRGILAQFAGPDQSGKTTTALDLVGQAQKQFILEYQQAKKDKKIKVKPPRPKSVLYVDVENTLNKEWSEKLGVDWEELLILRPNDMYAEQIFEYVLQIIETGEIGLVIIDSLGVMLSQQAFEKTVEEKTYAGIAQALTTFSKKAVNVCSRTGCTLIGINQVREDLNSPYGGLTTTGGRAWKHNISLNLMFRKGKFIDERGKELNNNSMNPAGNLVMVTIEKTKVCKPDRRVSFYTLKYLSGIDYVADTVDVAIKYGLVEKSGSWYTLVNPETGEVATYDEGEIVKAQGEANFTDLLLAIGKFDKLWQEVTDLVSKQV